MKVDRRAFIRESIHTALGGVAACSALGSLQLISAAAHAQTAGIPNDYKALVCVFLYGGNDSFNTIVPFDNTNYTVYRATRPALALSQASISAMALSPQPLQLGLPGGPPSDGGSYGLHPSMPELRTLFNAQRAAIVANVGPLMNPITAAQYQAGTRAFPPQLFSHDDQANFWQTSRPDNPNADGWGGRIADLLYASNPNQQLPMTMSLSSQSLFQRGSLIDQYVMNGAERIDYLGAYQNELGTSTFNALMADGTQAHMFERAYARATRRSIATYTMLNTALSAAPTWTTAFPASNLGAQLQQVANIISVRGSSGLNMRRQVFFVGLGGFDTHDDQITSQSDLLAQLSSALHAFNAATEQLGIASQITTFTASDFGRTLSTNGDGTDHGWGGHHIVMGGAVRGGRFYGAMPSLAQNNNPDDAGYGQVIPTTSVDQYAATLATWFGVNSGNLSVLFPRLGEFATANLGFIT
jgi:uncharacterized protein (DUF1501 family)